MDKWVWRKGGVTRGKLKYREKKKLLQFHFVHRKSHMDSPGKEGGTSVLRKGEQRA
jgi:hypothetical protein